MPFRTLIALVALTASALAGEIPHAKPSEVGLAPERLQRITRAMEGSVEKGHLAGAIGVVARKGKIAYWETVGMADREAGKPMADDTIFRIYSMTKPIVSVALMTLYEEGRFALRDPVRNYLPELGGLKVWADGAEVPSDREMTIQDLMRHTAGLTYGLFGDSAVDKMYEETNVLGGNRSVADFIAKLARLPLKHQPGTMWEYSVSVDVQGRLIEVLSGDDLATFMEARVFDPLEMRDTSFRMIRENAGRLAQIYKASEDRKGLVPASELRTGLYDNESRWYSGGGGLVSTPRDYLRFCQMMLNGGVLDGRRILSRKTVELMTVNHLGSVSRASSMPKRGYGFGLGFAVHVDPVESGVNGTAGEYSWGGLAGTTFWIDPAEDLIGLYMMQVLPPRIGRSGEEFKRLAYQAIAD